MAKKQTWFLAQYDSRYFSFHGFGDSPFHAMVALESALIAHCKRTGARLPDFYSPDTVSYMELVPGAGYIDKEKVTQ